VTDAQPLDDEPTPRPVGRPRQYDDEKERELIFSAAYRTLRDKNGHVTIAGILKEAGVSTRSFYRHFESKDALLCAMFRRDAQWAANKIALRLARAASPAQAVEWWIEEIFRMVGDTRRAERVAVLGTITSTTEGATKESAEARAMLIAPLADAIASGGTDGSFRVDDPASTAELLGATVLYAAGLSGVQTQRLHDVEEVSRLCLAALRG
jgi:AcrR family transcriptional regulator